MLEATAEATASVGSRPSLSHSKDADFWVNRVCVLLPIQSAVLRGFEVRGSCSPQYDSAHGPRNFSSASEECVFVSLEE